MGKRHDSACNTKKYRADTKVSTRYLVGEGGFEPPKSATTDLQSAPFGHSGTLPYEIGAGRRTRTPDLLITNQLLYQLSYTSILPRAEGSSTARDILTERRRVVNKKNEKVLKFFRERERNIKKSEIFPRRFADRQLQWPVGACSRCRAELYPGDVFWQIEGRLVCEDCLEGFARSYFAPCRTTGAELTQEDYRDT